MKRSDANWRRIGAIFWSRDPLPAGFASERFVQPSRTQKTFCKAFHGLSNGVDHYQFSMQMRALLVINQSPVHLSVVYLDDFLYFSTKLQLTSSQTERIPVGRSKRYRIMSNSIKFERKLTELSAIYALHARSISSFDPIFHRTMLNP